MSSNGAEDVHADANHEILILFQETLAFGNKRNF
jgi:hypothetical protein